MTKASENNTAQPTPTKKQKVARRQAAKPRETKRAQLIRMLKAAKGADVARISKKLGWQKHTTRAALTGLRNAGFTIDRNARDGGDGSVYRITAEPSAGPVR